MERDGVVIATGLGLATVAIALALAISGGDLHVWDEQIYAGAAYSVLDGHVLVPHFQLADHGFEVGPFLEKPPLAVWLQAISMAIFGETPVAARLPSALAAGGVVALTVLLGKRWFGLLAGAFAGGVLLVTNAMRSTHAMQHAVTDMQLLFWGLLAVYAADRVRDADSLRRWALVSGGALGAAIMTKGVAGVPFVLLVLPLAVRKPMRYLRAGLWAVIALLAIALPWHVLAYVAYPTEFVEEYIVEQIFMRSQGLFSQYTPGGLIPGSNFPYLKSIPSYFDVAFVGALGGLIADIYRLRDQWRPSFETAFCYVWAIFFPLGYAAAGGNFIWYMLPSAIPLALLAGRFAAPVADLVVTRTALLRR